MALGTEHGRNFCAGIGPLQMLVQISMNLDLYCFI